MAGIGLTPCRAMARKISATSKAGRGTRGRASAGRAARPWASGEVLQRAHDRADRLGGDARVERRRVELGMSEQNLDHPNIDVLLQQMGRKAVPQRMRRHLLGDLGQVCGRMAGAVELARRYRLQRMAARKQPAAGCAMRHQSRRRSSTQGDSIAYRSLRPLPCSMRISMRSLSMSDTFSDTTSEARRPAP